MTQRFGFAFISTGLAFIVVGWLGVGAAFRLELGVMAVALGCVLLVVDAILRTKSKHAVAKQGDA